jgi:hypothetical protein
MVILPSFPYDIDRVCLLSSVFLLAGLLKLGESLFHTLSFGLEVLEILLKLGNNFLSGGEVAG